MPKVDSGPDTAAQLAALDVLISLGQPEAAPGSHRRVPGPSTTAQLRAIDVLLKLGTAVFPRRRRRQSLGASVCVVIPAHDEGSSIGQTLASLREQTLRPEEVIVVCDNCTDDTEEVARAASARTFLTYGNTAKKAGALNQVLRLLLPELDPAQLVLVMDADSALNDRWLEAAADVLQRSPSVGAVCGVYFGDPGGGLLGQLQRNEYIRYGRSVHRQRQAPVLSGTGTLFRVSALREVLAARGATLPGRPGELYNTLTVTEDNEITFALKTLGYACVAVPGCETQTEVMPTLGHLYKQRIRWQTGTLTDLALYGFNPVTAFYWLRQVAMYVNICGTIACWVIIGASLVAYPALNVPWTVLILAVNLAARTWTVRRAGVIGVLVSLIVLPEYGYDLFRMVVFIRSLAKALGGGDVGWNHVQR